MPFLCPVSQAFKDQKNCPNFCLQLLCKALNPKTEQRTIISCVTLASKSNFKTVLQSVPEKERVYLLWVNKCCKVPNLMHKHREKYLVHPPSALYSFTVTLEAVTTATETCLKVTGKSWKLSWTLKQGISLATQNQVSWSCEIQALGTETDTKARFFLFVLSWNKLNKYIHTLTQTHTSMRARETCKTPWYTNVHTVFRAHVNTHKTTTETLVLCVFSI